MQIVLLLVPVLIHIFSVLKPAQQYLLDNWY